MDKITAACLNVLSYSPKWIEYGFLTPEVLLAQAARFRTGEDQNTEHYRYAAFKQLQQRDAFSDREFEQYVELAASDPDWVMGRAALVDLIDHRGLTEAQWEAVLAHPRVQELPKLIKKERLFKELRAATVSEETLWRCLEEGDGDVQRRMLDLSDLPRPLIEALQQRGFNKAVRNIAAIRLKRDQYRAPRY